MKISSFFNFKIGSILVHLFSKLKKVLFEHALHHLRQVMGYEI